MAGGCAAAGRTVGASAKVRRWLARTVRADPNDLRGPRLCCRATCKRHVGFISNGWCRTGAALSRVRVCATTNIAHGCRRTVVIGMMRAVHIFERYARRPSYNARATCNLHWHCKRCARVLEYSGVLVSGLLLWYMYVYVIW